MHEVISVGTINENEYWMRMWMHTTGVHRAGVRAHTRNIYPCSVSWFVCFVDGSHTVVYVMHVPRSNALPNSNEHILILSRFLQQMVFSVHNISTINFSANSLNNIISRFGTFRFCFISSLPRDFFLALSLSHFFLSFHLAASSLARCFFPYSSFLFSFGMQTSSGTNRKCIFVSVGWKWWRNSHCSSWFRCSTMFRDDCIYTTTTIFRRKLEIFLPSM